jgi:hypothetical protein
LAERADSQPYEKVGKLRSFEDADRPGGKKSRGASSGHDQGFRIRAVRSGCEDSSKEPVCHP